MSRHPRSEGDEHTVVKNVGSHAVSLEVWSLYAGDRGQTFYFPDFVLKTGAGLRVYTNRDIPGNFSFARGSAIGNNDGDCGILYDAGGVDVSSYCYP